VISFEIWSTFVFLLFVSDAIPTQISINLLDCSRLHIGLLSYILTWFLFWGPKNYRKAYWKNPGLICQQSMVVTKNAFWRSVNAFFPTSPFLKSCYIRNDFDCLEVTKCVSHLKYVQNSCSSYCFKTYHYPNFIILLECSRLHIGLLS
jgi:hypothetical protein